MVLEAFFIALVGNQTGVLILLWVEYGLGGIEMLNKVLGEAVLILLWVEYGLGALLGMPRVMQSSLNPSLGGIWSWSL